MANITNIQPPPTLPPVEFSQEISDDVEWVDDSVNHAHHPTGNFNGHHEEYPNTYDFTQESPLKYAGLHFNSFLIYPDHILIPVYIILYVAERIGSHTQTVQFNDHDDELPGPYDLYEESLSKGAGTLLGTHSLFTVNLI
jgi:hypothetical protein